MAHECEECGQMCYCDIEDTMNPQPSNCKHFEGQCECDNPWFGDDEDYDG